MSDRSPQFFLLAVSLSGCAKLTCTNTATIVIDGLPPHSNEDVILIDSRLKPDVNETRASWFYDTKQRVVINASGPLKLVPDTRQRGPNKAATTHTATIVVNGPPKPLRNYPILIDPSLKAEIDELHSVSSLRGPEKDTEQRIVIRSRVPLRLVPATPKETERLTRAAESGSRMSR